MKPKVKKVLTKIWQDKKDNTKWLKEAIEKEYNCVLDIGWQYKITMDSADIDNPVIFTDYYYGIHHDMLLTSMEALTEEDQKKVYYWDLLSHIPIAEIRGIEVVRCGAAFAPAVKK